MNLLELIMIWNASEQSINSTDCCEECSNKGIEHFYLGTDKFHFCSYLFKNHKELVGKRLFDFTSYFTNLKSDRSSIYVYYTIVCHTFFFL